MKEKILHKYTMLKAYKYRAYPTEKQKKFLERTFGCVRFIWNQHVYDLF